MTYDAPSPREAARYILEGNLGVNGIITRLRPDAAYYRALIKELREMRAQFQEAGKESIFDEDMETLRDAMLEREAEEKEVKADERFSLGAKIALFSAFIALVALGIMINEHFY